MNDDEVIYVMKKFGIYDMYEKLLGIDEHAAQQFLKDIKKQLDDSK